MLNNTNLGKFIILGLVVLVVLVFAAVGWSIANPPKKEESFNASDLKAKSLQDLGRQHIEDIGGVAYNSNPPTSGSHFPMWAKRGAYNLVMSDGYLIHSLEHGYVVISYNCGEKGSGTYTPLKKGEPLTKIQGDMKAAATMRPLTTDNPPQKEVDLPEAFQSAECQALIKDLSQFLDTYQRIVIVPRPNMDAKIALTAWTKIDKIDTFDKNRIGAFIDAFHNKGPEQTAE